MTVILYCSVRDYVPVARIDLGVAGSFCHYLTATEISTIGLLLAVMLALKLGFSTFTTQRSHIMEDEKAASLPVTCIHVCAVT